MSNAKDLIRARFEEAKAELAAHEVDVSAMRAKLDAAALDHELAVNKWRKAKNELVPLLKKEKAIALSEEIASLAMALGGRRMQDSA